MLLANFKCRRHFFIISNNFLKLERMSPLLLSLEKRQHTFKLKLLRNSIKCVFFVPWRAFLLRALEHCRSCLVSFMYFPVATPEQHHHRRPCFFETRPHLVQCGIFHVPVIFLNLQRAYILSVSLPLLKLQIDSPGKINCKPSMQDAYWFLQLVSSQSTYNVPINTIRSYDCGSRVFPDESDVLEVLKKL